MNKEKIGHELRRHITDAFAISTVYNPVQAAIETLGAGMPDAVSIKSRLINSGLVFGGLASLSKLRDYSMERWGITKETPRKYRALHDALFAVPFVLALKPLVYLASGSTDLSQIAVGTAGTTATAMALTPVLGFAVDSFRKLNNVPENYLIPRKKSSTLKKTIAAGLVAASIALTSTVYRLNGYIIPDSQRENTNQQVIEQVERQNPSKLELEIGDGK